MEIKHRINATTPFLRNREIINNRDIRIHVQKVTVNFVTHHRLEVTRTQHRRELFIERQNLEFIDSILQHRTRARKRFCRLVIGQKRHESIRIVVTQRCNRHKRLLAKEILRGTRQNKKILDRRHHP